MAERNNAPRRGEAEYRHKGKTYQSPKQEIRKLFYRGGRYTARQLNRLTESNDARKCISDLRKEGLNIIDMRLADGRKEYWLIKDDRQLSLWEGGIS